MTRSRLFSIAALIAVVLAATQPAWAQGIPKEDRVEFNKLLGERNRLVVKLDRLDARAAELMKRGSDATVIHAEQVSIQDQLDLAELRLSILATRHGVAVPAPPEPEPARTGAASGDDTDRRIGRAFARGRNRAIDLLRADGMRMLASIDFEPFLTQ